ncbi:MAG: glycosyltransferase family 2 protein [Bacteroidota bacterium]
MPTVTVILPTFNRASLVAKTIRSVLKQTMKDFELLVLDDGSSDRTKQVVQKIKDDRIRYIKHRHNIGFVANWTYGIKHAEGKYLTILGDDDIYKPDFLSKRVSVIERDPNLLAVTGAFECCDLEGTVIRHSYLPCTTDMTFAGGDLIDLTLGFSGEWFNGATLYRTAVVQSLWNNMMFAGTVVDLTMHINLALMPKAKVHFLTKSDMLLRVHPQQESINNNLFLSESAALAAMKLWHFKVKPGGMYLAKFRKRFSSDLNNYARILWDKGMVKESRSIFWQKLMIRPFSFETWLRYIRTFVATPHQ